MTSWFRTVFKDMPKVCVTPSTQYFNSIYAEGIIRSGLNMLGCKWRVKTGPTGPRFEFMITRKQGESANNARIESILLVVEQSPAECLLSSRSLSNIEGLLVKFLDEVFLLIRGQRRDLVT